MNKESLQKQKEYLKRMKPETKENIEAYEAAFASLGKEYSLFKMGMRKKEAYKSFFNNWPYNEKLEDFFKKYPMEGIKFDNAYHFFATYFLEPIKLEIPNQILEQSFNTYNSLKSSEAIKQSDDETPFKKH